MYSRDVPSKIVGLTMLRLQGIKVRGTPFAEFLIDAIGL